MLRCDMAHDHIPVIYTTAVTNVYNRLVSNENIRVILDMIDNHYSNSTVQSNSNNHSIDHYLSVIDDCIYKLISLQSISSNSINWFHILDACIQQISFVLGYINISINDHEWENWINDFLLERYQLGVLDYTFYGVGYYYSLTNELVYKLYITICKYLFITSFK